MTTVDIPILDARVADALPAYATPGSDGLDPGLIVRLLGSVPYLIGLGFDAAGFGLTIVALQTLPLFVVEAFTAGALAVTGGVGGGVAQFQHEMAQRDGGGCRGSQLEEPAG